MGDGRGRSCASSGRRRPCAAGPASAGGRAARACAARHTHACAGWAGSARASGRCDCTLKMGPRLMTTKPAERSGFRFPFSLRPLLRPQDAPKQGLLPRRHRVAQGQGVLLVAEQQGGQRGRPRSAVGSPNSVRSRLIAVAGLGPFWKFRHFM